jgi:hypothetical protein
MSDDIARSIEVAPPYRYARIYTGPDGETHFSDHELAFELRDFAPPAPPISVTETLATEGMAVISSPAGWDGDWHPTPRRQIIVLIAGDLETKVSDGEVRIFKPGDIILVEDVSGKGHISRVPEGRRGYALALPLAGE